MGASAGGLLWAFSGADNAEASGSLREGLYKNNTWNFMSNIGTKGFGNNLKGQIIDFFNPVGDIDYLLKIADKLDYLFGFGPYSNSGAGGGFVLYPNKPNTNLMKSVYQK